MDTMTISQIISDPAQFVDWFNYYIHHFGPGRGPYLIDFTRW